LNLKRLAVPGLCLVIHLASSRYPVSIGSNEIQSLRDELSLGRNYG
jgi:hypothetical protein